MAELTFSEKSFCLLWSILYFTLVINQIDYLRACADESPEIFGLVRLSIF